jgi:hypothetical protein
MTSRIYIANVNLLLEANLTADSGGFLFGKVSQEMIKK